MTEITSTVTLVEDRRFESGGFADLDEPQWNLFQWGRLRTSDDYEHLLAEIPEPDVGDTTRWGYQGTYGDICDQGLIVIKGEAVDEVKS